LTIIKKFVCTAEKRKTMSDVPKRKGVSTIDFFCIGFGAIVGVGWAVSINGWMTSCGGPIPAALGYLLVLVMMVPIGLCYAELVPMLPVAGGGMAFSFKAFNDKVALISGWASLGGMIAIIPWEAIQITDVLGYLVPGIKTGPVLYSVMGYDIHLIVVIIGTICSLLLFALNMRGLAAAALFQKILCIVLVGAGVVGAIAALIGGRAENLTPIYDVTNPEIYGEGLKQVSHHTMLGGMFAIVVQAAFFLAGFETIPQGIEDAGGSVKSVGKTVVLSVTLACVFYAVLLFCFGYGWPWQEFAGMARPAAATMFRSLYPGTAGKVLYWSLTVGAIAGLFTTWNGFFTASANLLMSMGRGRLIPKAFAYQNSRGVAVRGQVACLVLSLIGPLVGANLIDTVTCFSAVAFLLSWGVTCWSLVSLRKKCPTLDRPYRIPGGIGMGLWASVITTIVFVMSFIPSSPFFAGSLSVKMFIGWMVIALVLYLASSGQRRGLSEQELEAGVFGSRMGR